MEARDRLLIEALQRRIDGLETELQGLRPAAASRARMLAALSPIPGDKGDKGDKGDSIKGDPGLPGLPGKDGKDGLDGEPGRPGKDGLDGKDGPSHFQKGAVFVNPPGPMTVAIWQAPFRCAVQAIHGFRKGGAIAAVNARKLGGVQYLGGALWLPRDEVWERMPVSGLYAAGESLELMLVSAPEKGIVAVQVDFERLGA